MQPHRRERMFIRNKIRRNYEIKCEKSSWNAEIEDNEITRGETWIIDENNNAWHYGRQRDCNPGDGRIWEEERLELCVRSWRTSKLRWH